MLPNPVQKRAQARITIQHSLCIARTARPTALPPRLRRHPRPPSGQANQHRLKDLKRRLHPYLSARPTLHPPRDPSLPSPIVQATTPTVMSLQLAIHPRRIPQVRGRVASPLLHPRKKHSPTLMDLTRPRPHVEAWTKPRRKFRLRQEAKILRQPMATAAVAAPSINASQAIKAIVPST